MSRAPDRFKIKQTGSFQKISQNQKLGNNAKAKITRCKAILALSRQICTINPFFRRYGRQIQS
jgi:hypothetical protein